MERVDIFDESPNLPSYIIYTDCIGNEWQLTQLGPS